MNTDRLDAANLYIALLNGSRLTQLRRLTYRDHSHRCLLLDAVETPYGIILHQNPYKLSRAVNSTHSSEDGRVRNTRDGDNHWQQQTFYLDRSVLSHADDGPGHLNLVCDHVLDYPLTATEFQTDWDAGTREVRIRPNQSRYAL